MSIWMVAYMAVSSLMIITLFIMWAIDCNWYDVRLETLASTLKVKEQFQEYAEEQLADVEDENKQLRAQIDDLQQKLRKVAYPSAETLQQLVRFVGHHQHCIESNKELAEACVSLGEIAECILVDKET